MSEPDSSEALQTEIDAATQAGDLGLANELYLRQIGSQELVPDYEPALPTPVVQDQDQDADAAEPEDTGPSPSDIEDQGGGGMNDYVPYDTLSEDEQDTAFQGVMDLSEPGVGEGILKLEWPGAEYDSNREFGNAALRAVSGYRDKTTPARKDDTKPAKDERVAA